MKQSMDARASARSRYSLATSEPAWLTLSWTRLTVAAALVVKTSSYFRVFINDSQVALSYGFPLRLMPYISDIGDSQLVEPGQFHAPGQVGVHPEAVVGIRGHHELPAPETKQVIFVHNAAHPLVVHLPPTPFQLGGDPRPAIRGKLQSDALEFVSQIQIPVWTFLFRMESI